jgi:hypothetical protein
MTSSGLESATFWLQLQLASFFYTNIIVEGKPTIAELVLRRVRRPGFESPERQEVCIFFTASRLVLGPTQSAIQWVAGALSPGIKRSGREADHSLPSSTDFKNVGAIPPLPHMSS